MSENAPAETAKKSSFKESLAALPGAIEAKLPSMDKSLDRYGLKVLRQDERDRVLVVAAGITVHEALKAYEILKEKDILIRVIDLYSLQPFDGASVTTHARACHGRVIAVEDHYCNALGGLVARVVRDVSCLCVREIPRSGSSEELLRRYGIDAASIVAMVEQMCSQQRV